MKTLDATQVLRDDHKVIRGLFRQFESLRVLAPNMKPGIVREILMELEVHSKIEQEIFYPALRESLSERSRSFVEEAMADHQRIDWMIRAMRTLDPGSPECDRKLRLVIERVEEHLEVEEHEVLTAAEKELSPRVLATLGDQMLKWRTKLLSTSRFRRSRPEVVQDPRGGEQKRRKAA